MLKNGAPPDNIGVLFRLLQMEILWFKQFNQILKVITALVHGIISICIVWVPLIVVLNLRHL